MSCSATWSNSSSDISGFRGLSVQRVVRSIRGLCVPHSNLPRPSTYRHGLKLVPITLIMLAFTSVSRADTPACEPIQSAAERGVRILEKAARNYPEHRDCFACHHQTLPLLALREARRIGIQINEPLFADTVKFVREHFEQRTDEMRSGNGIPGLALAVAYGAWSFELADVPAPESLRRAMAMYVVWRQESDGRWRPSAFRPPAEQSHVSNTSLALRTLQPLFSEDAEWSVTALATQRRALEWLDQQPCDLQEDLVFRMWSLTWFGDDAVRRREFIDRIAKRQGEDGGWSAERNLPSEAYSTGLTLFALLDNGVARDSLMIVKAVEYLMKIQQPDGSWFVETRAKPVQVFFDNGDPHGKSQFISITATGWSTAALARFVARNSEPEQQ